MESNANIEDIAAIRREMVHDDNKQAA